MMMINSPSDGGELNRLNSLGVRVRSKVKIPLKNKVNYINTTNPPQALHRSFSAVMKESVQRCRFNYYVHGPAPLARNILRGTVRFAVDMRYARRQCASRIYSDLQQEKHLLFLVIVRIVEEVGN